LVGLQAVHILPGDLGDQQHAKAVIDTAAKSMGGIDILHLNHVVGCPVAL
jgi:NAD(P)-dependent dehydrogenase (short-subunit alcohol dehydrogenase family)